MLLSLHTQTPYLQAVAQLEVDAAEVAAGAPERLRLMEHAPCYTAGTSAKAEHLLAGAPFPVYATGRGGDYTYHGPGQRMIYPTIRLQARHLGPREYVRLLLESVIEALVTFDIAARVDADRPGVWVGNDKIAAIGVRIRRGTAFHGMALNVAPQLAHFNHIVPCGLRGTGVTAMFAPGAAPVDIADAALIAALMRRFPQIDSNVLPCAP